MSDFKLTRIFVAIANPWGGITNAIRRASALAHKTGASIELFHAIPSIVSAGMAHADAEHFTRMEAQESRRRLERTANRLRREELIVNTYVQTGYPIHEAILRQVRLAKAELVIIEARKHNVFARLLLTQTDFELIRGCPVPLLIVKGRAAWRSPRILAALDPFHSNDKSSALDAEIVDAARAMADVVRGSVHAVHVYRPLDLSLLGVPIGPVLNDPIAAQEKAYKTAVRRRFVEAVGSYAIAKGKTHLVCGDPATEIPALARSMRAGLVVMGATSRSGLKRIFIGNTAEHVLDSLKCDVLVVRSPK
ncbi:MAG: universal stress protein [Steroidobacteraceae bacterium]|jgi:universal stress protein E